VWTNTKRTNVFTYTWRHSQRLEHYSHQASVVFQSRVVSICINTLNIQYPAPIPRGINMLCTILMRARGGAVGCGTELQAGGSQVRFPMVSLVVFFSFRPHYGPGVDSASNRNEYQVYFLGSKGGRCVGLTLPRPCTDCLKIWEPQGLSRSVLGLLYDSHNSQKLYLYKVRTDWSLQQTQVFCEVRTATACIIKTLPCRGSGGWSPASHPGSPGSIPVQLM
jgi:hypothetical protein